MTAVSQVAPAGPGVLRRLRARRAEAPMARLRQPLDLSVWAPEATLAASHAESRELKRLRRIHRLAGPIVLYVGPYTPAGGLAAAVAVVSEIHRTHEDVRLVALPDGKIDRRYLNRCERGALGLGHHGIVEWTSDPAELHLWFALATVVVGPDPETSPVPRAVLAAAAGRPFVGGRFPGSRETVVDGETGVLLDTPVDPDALARAVEALVADPAEADRLGAAARARIEAA